MPRIEVYYGPGSSMKHLGGDDGFTLYGTVNRFQDQIRKIVAEALTSDELHGSLDWEDIEMQHRHADGFDTTKCDLILTIYVKALPARCENLPLRARLIKEQACALFPNGLQIAIEICLNESFRLEGNGCC